MLFNSLEFIFIFFPIVGLIFYSLSRRNLFFASKVWLIISSLFFYSWWNVKYLPLLLLSVVFNFLFSILILRSEEKPLQKRLYFIFTLLMNVSFLGYFKYSDFFIENINLSFGYDIPLLGIILPLAISFFTIQQIVFIVDTYQGVIKENKFINYCLFVVLFPQLIAGPIVRHKEIYSHLDSLGNKRVSHSKILLGLAIFSLGLFKKVIIADSFSVISNHGYMNLSDLNLLSAWITSVSYSLQIYFDFSAYSEMAIGLGLFFGLRLPLNFNNPYLAINIIDYWKRWHITLTSFITSYIYNPILRLSKKPTFSTAMVVSIIAFLVSGIWHGASWMFVIWGGLHGVGIVINHIYKRNKFYMPTFLSWFITMNYINFTFIFFRSSNLSEAQTILKSMIGLNGLSREGLFPGSDIIFSNDIIYFFQMIFGTYFVVGMLFLISIFMIVKFVQVKDILDSQNISNKTLVLIFLFFIISVLTINTVSEFIYFNF